MGVPGFFAWIIKNCKHTQSKHIQSNIVLNSLDIKFDTLYLDANCLFHPQCFKVLEHFGSSNFNKNKLEEMMIKRILNYIDYLITFINPSSVFIAVDGVAPMAKMNQQRQRRYKAVYDSQIRNKIKDKHNVEYSTVWDNSCITPGTEFMEKLHLKIQDHIKLKNVSYIYSSYHEAGEGEHKILQHIKKYSKDKVNIIYGLDADLIFLSLASNCKQMYLLREAQHFGKTINKPLDPDFDDVIEDVEEDLNFVDINALRSSINNVIKKSLNIESKIESKIESGKESIESKIECGKESIECGKESKVECGKESIKSKVECGKESIKSKIESGKEYIECGELVDEDYCNDFIFMCYLLGNDFLPHIPSINISVKGLELLLQSYTEIKSNCKESLITFRSDKQCININTSFLLNMLQMLAKYEDNYFRTLLPSHLKRMASRQCPSNNEYERDIWNFENLRDIDIDIDLNSVECINVECVYDNLTNYKFNYYQRNIGVSEYKDSTVNIMCQEYFKSLVWVTKYYFESCICWEYHYPYSYAPFISDLATYLDKNKDLIIKNRFKEAQPLNPAIQLLVVLPPQRAHLLPKQYRRLIESTDSTIVDMFPYKIKIDTVNQTQQWKCTALVPSVNIERVRQAVQYIKLKKTHMFKGKLVI